MNTRHPWRWIIPVAYILVLDSFLALALLSPVIDPESTGMYGAVLGPLSIAAAVLFAATLTECIVLHATNAPCRRTFARRVMLLTKIGLLPFFILGELVMAALMILSIHPVLAVTGWIAIPFATAIGWAAMMGGSIWAMSYALGLYRDGLISGGECTVHVVLQVFFFADVVDAIILFVRGRKKELQLWQTDFAPAKPADRPIPPSIHS